MEDFFLKLGIYNKYLSLILKIASERSFISPGILGLSEGRPGICDPGVFARAEGPVRASLATVSRG
jgi:hypothetical protein